MNRPALPESTDARRLPVPGEPGCVTQCRMLRLFPGDVLESRTESPDGAWSDVELTLLHLGARSALWSVRRRSHLNPEWAEDGMSSKWTLDCHTWYRRPHPTDGLVDKHLLAAARLPYVYPKSPYKNQLLSAVMARAVELPAEIIPVVMPHAALWLNDFAGLADWLARFHLEELYRRTLARGQICSGVHLYPEWPRYSSLAPALIATHAHWSPVRPAADLLLRALCRWADFRIRNHDCIIESAATPKETLFELATHLPFTAEEWDRLSLEPDFPFDTFLKHPPHGLSPTTRDIWYCAGVGNEL